MLCAFALTMDAGKETPEYGNDSMAGVLLVAVTVFVVNCFVLMPLSTYKTIHGRYPWNGKQSVEGGKDGGQGPVVGGRDRNTARSKKTTKVAPAKELNDVKSWGRR